MNLSKLSVFLLFLVITPTYAQLCSGTKVILLDSIDYNVEPNWQLVFDEEFLGDTLDLGKWGLPISSQGALDGTGAYFTLDNVKVSPELFTAGYSSAKGVCKIIANKETVIRPPVSWDPSIAPVTYNYTSASIESKQQFGWGKYEIRCKVPKGKGFWPAFWLYGEKNGRGDEIDVFEFWNEDNVLREYDPKKLAKEVKMHYHFWEKSVPKQSVDHNCGSTHKFGTDFSQEYHTFTLIWNRFTIEWYVDGELMKQVGQWYDIRGELVTPENIKPAQVVFRNDWYPKNEMTIIFGFGIQSGKNTPDEDSPFPSAYNVDYIRYYSY